MRGEEEERNAQFGATAPLWLELGLDLHRPRFGLVLGGAGRSAIEPDFCQPAPPDDCNSAETRFALPPQPIRPTRPGRLRAIVSGRGRTA
jgi:hypothetical protein